MSLSLISVGSAMTLIFTTLSKGSEDAVVNRVETLYCIDEVHTVLAMTQHATCLCDYVIPFQIIFRLLMGCGFHRTSYLSKTWPNQEMKREYCVQMNRELIQYRSTEIWVNEFGQFPLVILFQFKISYPAESPSNSWSPARTEALSGISM